VNPADVLPIVLLLLVVAIFLAAIIMVAFASRWHRLAWQNTSRFRMETILEHRPADNSPVERVTPRPRLWLAVQHPDAAGVFATLGLNHPQPGHWNTCEPGSGRMFVSVPINGWTLVAGDGIPDPFDDVDRTYKFLVNLSTALGHVQLFALDPIFNFHAWARLESGRVIRAYAWAGRTLWNQGHRTLPEQRLGLNCLAYGEEVDAFDWPTRDRLAENLSRLPFLAAQWSLDPAELEAVPSMQTAGAAGFAGRIVS
jgi:hypothetical protein